MNLQDLLNRVRTLDYAMRQRVHERLLRSVAKRLPDARRRWLAPVVDQVEELIKAAQDANLSDAEFKARLEAAYHVAPALFKRMDHGAIANLLEESMAAAALNGALHGYARRGPPTADLKS